jgi:hypothetical protein
MLGYWTIHGCYPSPYVCLVHAYESTLFMLLCYIYSLYRVILFIYECFVKLVLSNFFGCMVCWHTYARIYMANFFSSPNLLFFVQNPWNICIRIRNRLSSNPRRIRREIWYRWQKLTRMVWVNHLELARSHGLTICGWRIRWTQCRTRWIWRGIKIQTQHNTHWLIDLIRQRNRIHEKITPK